MEMAKAKKADQMPATWSKKKRIITTFTTIMKYIIRSLKYFVYLTIILILFVAAIYLITAKGAPLESMLKDGYNSLWKMALIVLAFAAVYPSFGYGKRNLRAKGAADEIIPTIEKTMGEKGYILVSRDHQDNLVFRKASTLARITAMFEDKVYFTRNLGGYEMEGRLKEIVRLDSALYELFQEPGE